MKKEIKQVNQSLGKNASIGIFTGFQFVISILAFGVGFIVSSVIGLETIWSILIGLWLAATVLILSGKKPYLFWSRIYPPVPLWTRGYVKYSSPLEKKKAGAKKVKLWF